MIVPFIEGKPKDSPLIRRIKLKIATSKAHAQKRNHKPILSSPEEVLAIWVKQKGLCCACRCQLKKGITGVIAHHNHDTGEFIGFSCNTCNVIEGLLRSKSSDERTSLLQFIMKSLS